MRIVALYHPASEKARSIEEYATDFARQKGERIELVSLETPEGSELAKLYAVVRYPALLAITDDGQLEKLWEDEELPLKDEVAGYLHS